MPWYLTLLAVLLGVLVGREVWCWYTKMNQVVKLLQQVTDELRWTREARDASSAKIAAVPPEKISA